MSEAPFRVEQIDHVELFVPDRHEAAAWYRDVLGLELLDRFNLWLEGGGPLIVSSDDGATKLALFEGEPPGFRAPVGFRRVAFRVDGPGFIKFLKRLSEHPVFDHDGKGTHQLEQVDHEIAYSVYFCDPYGNRFEVTTYEYEEVKRETAGGSVH